jgi:hypothetical protein
MGRWLLDVFDHFSGLRSSGRHHKARVDPSLLPGWMYSRALAMRMDEDNKKEKVMSYISFDISAMLKFRNIRVTKEAQLL